MKIVGMSDLHGQLISPSEVPECDVVCIAGDISPLDIQRDKFLSTIWFGNKFIPWCESLPCKKVILVAGNHDFFLEDYNRPGGVTLKLGKENKLIYLRDSMYKFNHKSFYGTPWVTGLPNWAFNLEWEAALSVFHHIPNCDVLIAHTPPFDANLTGNVFASDSKPDFGSWELRDAITEKQVGLILCGHVHSGNHNISDWQNHKIVNVSLLNEDYKLHYSPTLIEI